MHGTIACWQQLGDKKKHTKKKRTGLRRLNNIPDKEIFRRFVSTTLFLLFFDFLMERFCGLDRKVREGVILISSNFHPNPSTGSPKTNKKRNSP